MTDKLETNPPIRGPVPHLPLRLLPPSANRVRQNPTPRSPAQTLCQLATEATKPFAAVVAPIVLPIAATRCTGFSPAVVGLPVPNLGLAPLAPRCLLPRPLIPHEAPLSGQADADHLSQPVPFFWVLPFQ